MANESLPGTAFPPSGSQRGSRRASAWLAMLSAVGILAVGVGLSATAQAAPCVLKEKVEPSRGARLYQHVGAKDAIARLTGSMIPIKMSGFEAFKTSGRLNVSTAGTRPGKGYVRVDGFALASDFAFYAYRDLPVVPDHIWIARGQRVDLTGSLHGKVGIKHQILASRNQSLATNVPCNHLTLNFPTLTTPDVPKRARFFETKYEGITLYDAPNGREITRLEQDEAGRRVFWSTRQKGRFARIQIRSDIVVDAWARVSDLKPRRSRDVADQRVRAPQRNVVVRPKLVDPPAAVRIVYELPFYRQAVPIKPDGKTKRPKEIGWLEVGARVYPLEVKGEWTNILPTDLGVMPLNKNGFWVRTVSLKKGSEKLSND